MKKYLFILLLPLVLHAAGNGPYPISGGGGSPTTDASLLTSGTLPDARLSGNVGVFGTATNLNSVWMNTNSFTLSGAGSNLVNLTWTWANPINTNANYFTNDSNPDLVIKLQTQKSGAVTLPFQVRSVSTTSNYYQSAASLGYGNTTFPYSWSVSGSLIGGQPAPVGRYVMVNTNLPSLGNTNGGISTGGLLYGRSINIGESNYTRDDPYIYQNPGGSMTPAAGGGPNATIAGNNNVNLGWNSVILGGHDNTNYGSGSAIIASGYNILDINGGEDVMLNSEFSYMLNPNGVAGIICGFNNTNLCNTLGVQMADEYCSMGNGGDTAMFQVGCNGSTIIGSSTFQNGSASYLSGTASKQLGENNITYGNNDYTFGHDNTITNSSGVGVVGNNWNVSGVSNSWLFGFTNAGISFNGNSGIGTVYGTINSATNNTGTLTVTNGGTLSGVTVTNAPSVSATNVIAGTIKMVGLSPLYITNSVGDGIKIEQGNRVSFLFGGTTILLTAPTVTTSVGRFQTPSTSSAAAAFQKSGTTDFQITDGNGTATNNLLVGGAGFFTNGFASYATNAPTIGSTGWTNNLGKTINIYNCTGVGIIVYDCQTNVVCNYGTLTTGQTISVQDKGMILGTSIVGTAHAF